MTYRWITRLVESGVQKQASYFRKKRRDSHGDVLRANIWLARYRSLILIARCIINSRLIVVSPVRRYTIGNAVRVPVLFIYLWCGLIYNRYARRPSALRNRCWEHAAAVYHYARKRGVRERERERRITRSSSPRCLSTHAIKHSALSSVLALWHVYASEAPKASFMTWSLRSWHTCYLFV